MKGSFFAAVGYAEVCLDHVYILCSNVKSICVHMPNLTWECSLLESFCHIVEPTWRIPPKIWPSFCLSSHYLAVNAGHSLEGIYISFKTL